jgi:RsiW-degrading membrane proteinase PrsW (M82 family)
MAAPRHGQDRSRPRLGLIRGAVVGAAAGAAGTTALNSVTYADMTVRARPASDTPERTVEEASKKLGVPVPGSPDEQKQRVAGLGPLTGIAAGVGTGALIGAMYGLGWRPRRSLLALAAGGAAMLAGNGPMTVLGITDPRSWSATDWISDVVPHLAYGAVTAALIGNAERSRSRRIEAGSG